MTRATGLLGCGLTGPTAGQASSLFMGLECFGGLASGFPKVPQGLDLLPQQQLGSWATSVCDSQRKRRQRSPSFPRGILMALRKRPQNELHSGLALLLH